MIRILMAIVIVIGIIIFFNVFRKNNHSENDKDDIVFKQDLTEKEIVNELLKELPATSRVLSFQGKKGSIIEITHSMDQHILEKVICMIGHQPTTPYVSFRIISDLKAFYNMVESYHPEDLESLNREYEKIGEEYQTFFKGFSTTKMKQNIFKEKHHEALEWFVNNYMDKFDTFF